MRKRKSKREIKKVLRDKEKVERENKMIRRDYKGERERDRRGNSETK